MTDVRSLAADLERAAQRREDARRNLALYAALAANAKITFDRNEHKRRGDALDTARAEHARLLAELTALTDGMLMTKAKDQLETYLAYGGFGRVEREVVFHPTRKWRLDYYLPDQEPPVAVEYDGLMRHGENQGHASIGGILRDSEKCNEAQAMGIRVFRVNAKTIHDGSAFTLLDRVLRRKDVA